MKVRRSGAGVPIASDMMKKYGIEPRPRHANRVKERTSQAGDSLMASQAYRSIREHRDSLARTLQNTASPYISFFTPEIFTRYEDFSSSDLPEGLQLRRTLDGDYIIIDTVTGRRTAIPYRDMVAAGSVQDLIAREVNLMLLDRDMDSVL